MHGVIATAGFVTGLIARFDFTTLTPGAVATLPGGLLLTRASSATVQTATDTVVTSGIGNDVARAGRRVTADLVGLLLEEARTNSHPWSRAPNNAGLSAGSGDTYPLTGQPSPDGTNNAVEVVVTSGNLSKFALTLGIGAVSRVGSLWVIKGPGSGLYQASNFVGGSTAQGSAVFGTAGATWSRAITPSFLFTAGQNVGLITNDGRAVTYTGGENVARARDAEFDLIQWETGKFATEVQVTAGAAATRAGERLRYPTASQLVSHGRIAMATSVRPKGAVTDYSSNMRLFTDANDATTYAEISCTTGQVIVSIGGSTYTTPAAMSWSPYDSVNIWVEAGGGVQHTLVTYQVNGAPTVLLGESGTAQGNIPATGALDLLCSGTAQQFSSWITALEFYR